MAITDELREAIGELMVTFLSDCKIGPSPSREAFYSIADRIDEEHWRAKENSYRDGYQEGKRDGDDEWYEEHEAYLEEHGWYQALDADKEPIKFGDEVEWRRGCGDHELRHGIVTGIRTDDIGGELVHEVAVNVDGFTVRLMASVLHHVKRQTVEDVLWDMHMKLDEVAALHADEPADSDERERDVERIFAEYAAKLQLRGDAE